MKMRKMKSLFSDSSPGIGAVYKVSTNDKS